MRPLTLGLIALFALLATPHAFGQGIYRPLPDRGPPAERLTLISHAVHADVTESFATIRVEQTFRNPSDATIEGTYLFPVPRDAIASGVLLTIGGKEVAGEVLDAAFAKKTYCDIVRKMKDPALLEYVNAGLLRASIYPIGPRADVKIAFTFAAPAMRVGALSSLVLPLKFAADTGAAVTVDASLSSKRSLSTVYSPTHPVDVAREGPRRARITFEGRVDRPRDFRLYFAHADGDGPTLSLLAHRREGEDGTFVLMIGPPTAETKAEDPVPRDVVFVLDRSGSMAGEKWEQATNALAHGLKTLRAIDRFTIVSFATDVRCFRDSLVTATAEERLAGASHLDGLRAAGGTNIDAALGAALGVFGNDSKRLRLVAFLTDGLPTVGETDVGKILSRATDGNRDGARVFSFGVGHDVNTVLLDRLAQEHSGTSDFVEPEESLERRVSAFFDKVAAPYLAAPRLSFGGVEVFDVDPPRLPDVFYGGSLVVTGRYRGHGPAAIQLTGQRAGGETTVIEDVSWARTNTDHPFVPTLWAGRRVGTLLQQIRLNGAKTELIDEVMRLGREYGIVTPYTSGLVVEEGMRLGRVAGAPGAPPSGGAVTGDRKRRDEAEKKSRAKLATLDDWESDDELAVGKEAVRRARKIGRLESGLIAESRRVERAGHAVERFEAAGRVLVGIAGVLVDRSCTDEAAKQALDIKAFSEKYFDLLRAHPELSPMLSLGPDILFMLDGHAVRIRP